MCVSLWDMWLYGRVAGEKRTDRIIRIVEVGIFGLDLGKVASRSTVQHKLQLSQLLVKANLEVP